MSEYRNIARKPAEMIRFLKEQKEAMLRHKWFLSENAGYDVGEYAFVD